MEDKQLVLIGKVTVDYDHNVSIIENGRMDAEAISALIGDFIEKNNNKLSKMYSEDVDEDLGYRVCTSQENIQLRFYSSDTEIKSKEEIEEKYFEKMLGSLDISVENVGYSEYTITGYVTENFTLGVHDLEEIFRNYIDKYVCIIVDKED